MEIMNKLLVNITADETRIAYLQQDEFTDLFIERNNKKSVIGNLYKGKVLRILPTMQVAFVDIGLDKAAYIQLSDIVTPRKSTSSLTNITLPFHEGQEILVQALKDPVADKGIKVTTRIKLSSCLLVLSPYEKEIHFSKKITDFVQRNEIIAALKPYCTSQTGFIVRSFAKQADTKQLTQDAERLLTDWQVIFEKYKKSKIGLCYSQPALEIQLLRDNYFDQAMCIYIDDLLHFTQLTDFISSYLPSLKHKVQYYTESTSLFAHYHLESRIDALLSSSVELKSGATLIIEKTQAMTVIDVNSGAYIGNVDSETTALKINQEAASEIVKQIRLRQLSGIIVIDFINLTKEQHKKQILMLLNKAFKNEQQKVRVGQFSTFGLVEIARQRIRPALDEIVLEPCSTCHGGGRAKSIESLCYDIYRQVQQTCLKEKSRHIILIVAPQIADALLNNRYLSIKALVESQNKQLEIKIANHYTSAQFVITAP